MAVLHLSEKFRQRVRRQHVACCVRWWSGEHDVDAGIRHPNENVVERYVTGDDRREAAIGIFTEARLGRISLYGG